MPSHKPIDVATKLDSARRAVEQILADPLAAVSPAEAVALALLYIGDSIRAAAELLSQPMTEIGPDGKCYLMPERPTGPPPVCSGAGQLANWPVLTAPGPCPICGQPVRIVEHRTDGYFIEAHPWRAPDAAQ